MRATLLRIVLICALGAAPAAAQELRQFNPIMGPGAAAPLPAGAQPGREFVPISRAEVEAGVRRVMESWNTPQFEQKLAENFYDKQRLGDALDTLVPRDAKIRVLGLQGTQTLSQAAAREAERILSEAAAHPLVKAALETYPGAAIEAVRDLGPAPARPEADGEREETNGEDG